MIGDLPRVLFVGNSHSGSLRLAYAAEADRWPGWDVYFLGVLSDRLGELDLRDDRLVPMTGAASRQMQYYNHVNSVDVGGFDALVIVGGVSWFRTAAICADHRSLDFPSVVAGDETAQLVGGRVLGAMLRGRIAGSAVGQLLPRIERLQKPVVVVPEPALSEDGRADDARYGAYHALVQRGDATHWLDMYRAARMQVLGDSATILDWPEAALVDGPYTASSLMRGSRRLGRIDAAAIVEGTSAARAQREVAEDGEGPTHPDDDYEHANATYGAMVMDQVMSMLSTR